MPMRLLTIATLLTVFTAALVANAAPPDACVDLHALELPRESRLQIVDDCRNNPERFRTRLVELARLGDWQAAFLVRFAWPAVAKVAPAKEDAAAASPSAAIADLSSAFDQTREGVECKKLREPLRAAPGDAGAVRRVRLLGAGKHCFDHIRDPSSPYYVTVVIQASDHVLFLPDSMSGVVQLTPFPLSEGAAQHVVLMALAAGQGGVLWVLPDGSAVSPPMVWRVDPDPGSSSRDQLIDTVNDRRIVSIRVARDKEHRLLVNGYPIAAPADGERAPTVVVRRRAQLSRVAVVHTEKTTFSKRSVVVLREKLTDERSASVDVPFAYERNFVQEAQQIGILPIFLESCSRHGIDESVVRDRVTAFLKAREKHVGELGLLADAARKYASALASVSELPGEATTSRGPLRPDVQFGSGARELIARGYESLLDIRLSCSTSRGQTLFAVTAVRFYVNRIAEETAEGTRRPEKPLFRVASHVITDPMLLRDGVIVPIAKLWQLPTTRLVEGWNRHVLHSPLGVRVERSGPNDSSRIQLQVIKPKGDDNDALRVCRSVERANKLQAPLRVAELHNEVATEKANGEERTDVPISTPGRYIVRTVGASPQNADEQSSFRCVNMTLPAYAISADFYFGSLAKLHAVELENRPERSSHRFVLGHVGQPNGLAPSFGYWVTRRQGKAPSSWIDLTAASSAQPDGSIPYTYDLDALMLGLSLGLKKHWPTRHIPFELRGYLLPRIELTDDDRVPSTLIDFTGSAANENQKWGLDVTLAAAAGIGVEPTPDIAIQARVAIAIPKLTHAVRNFWIDEEDRRRVWFDPETAVVFFGLGGSYLWGN